MAWIFGPATAKPTLIWSVLLREGLLLSIGAFLRVTQSIDSMLWSSIVQHCICIYILYRLWVGIVFLVVNSGKKTRLNLINSVG